MSVIKLNEQITFLRKQKGITQEELAKELGVTNQSISKWESAQCCPDIQLLPEIAAYFNVSIDELMGYKSADTFENVYLQIKSLFETTPMEDSFSVGFKLSALLHECIFTKGYREDVPWDTSKNYSIDNKNHKWGYSAYSDSEGITVHRSNSVFISDNKIGEPISYSTIKEVFSSIEPLCERNTLRVLFGLYELTIKDSDYFVPIEAIEEACKLSRETVLSALDNLPIQVKDTEDGKSLYRIEGCHMHIPAILLMLSMK